MREKGVQEMKCSLFLAAGTAAGMMLLAPAAALATTPTAPTTTATGDGPLITQSLGLNPTQARPGDRIKLAFHCVISGPGELVVTAKSVALDFDRTGANRWTSAKVKDVKPGKYDVVLGCGSLTSTASLQVVAKKAPVKTPPKQVGKVPAGAPQTGGTDGPIGDDSNGPALAAGAMGVLAVGGAGLVALRRRRAQD